MTITLNGETTGQFVKPMPVSEMLDQLKMSGKPVLVELNGVALYPREFAEKLIEDGARIELIQIAAGG